MGVATRRQQKGPRWSHTEALEQTLPYLHHQEADPL